jgi:hypothetical protein
MRIAVDHSVGVGPEQVGAALRAFAAIGQRPYRRAGARNVEALRAFEGSDVDIEVPGIEDCYRDGGLSSGPHAHEGQAREPILGAT